MFELKCTCKNSDVIYMNMQKKIQDQRMTLL